MKTPNSKHTNNPRSRSGLFSRAARSNRGFTMIELMIVVAIMGILLGVGVPSFRSMIINQRIKSASFDLYTSLLAARSEALTRNTTVMITPASGTNWATGWNVTASGGAVLKTQNAFPGVAFIPKVSPLASIVYNSSGRLNAAVPPMTLYAAGAAGSEVGRCVTLDLSGRPVTTKGVCP